MSTTIDEGLAFHEAGHAIVAFKLGIRILSVGIRPEQGKGYCKDAYPSRTLTFNEMSDADWNWARKQALILLGGKAAERVYYLDDDLPFCANHDEDELAELCCSAFGGLGPEASRWLEKRRDETDTIVMNTANWKGICALAELLVLKNHVSGAVAEWTIRGGHSIDLDWP